LLGEPGILVLLLARDKSFKMLLLPAFNDRRRGKSEVPVWAENLLGDVIGKGENDSNHRVINIKDFTWVQLLKKNEYQLIGWGLG
jgi:hypothetical protein